MQEYADFFISILACNLGSWAPSTSSANHYASVLYNKVAYSLRKRAFEILIQIMGTEMLTARSGEQGKLKWALLCCRLALACSDAHFFSMHDVQ